MSDVPTYYEQLVEPPPSYDSLYTTEKEQEQDQECCDCDCTDCYCFCL
jgi:hypothetical protein